jgi:hypothetical protein
MLGNLKVARKKVRRIRGIDPYPESGLKEE